MLSRFHSKCTFIQKKTQKPITVVLENFPGHRFETQIHIQTQIRLNDILSLATKHLMIINKDNICLHLKAF